MILIVGGTGMLGTVLAKQLADAGHPVEIMSRNPRMHAGKFSGGIKLIEGDLTDEESLRRAVNGKSCVVAAAHSILGRGRSASRYVDELGTRNLIDQSIAAGVKHFIYVSAWYPQGSRLNAFFAAKQRVVGYLRSTNLTHTIIRPTAFMDMHAEQLIGQRIRQNDRVIVFGRGMAPRNFVSADDVATVIAGCVENSAKKSQTIDVGGPQNLTARDIIRIYEALFERSAKLLHVPLAVTSVLRWTFKPFHPGLSQIMDMTEQVERKGDGFVVKDNPQCANHTSLKAWAENRMREH